MDFLDKLEEAAASGGKAAMEQMDRLRKLAAAEARLLQLKRELCELYMEIGNACWTKYRKEAEQLFPRQCSRIRAIQEERCILEERLRKKGKS